MPVSITTPVFAEGVNSPNDSTTVAVSRALGASTVQVASGTGSYFASATTSSPIRLTAIRNADNSRTHFFVTAVTGDVLTIQVADGYSDISLNVNDTLQSLDSKEFFTDLHGVVQTCVTAINTLGSEGVQGPQGATGIQGATGSQGIAGSQGPQGQRGFQGFVGIMGNQGYQGVAGTNGSNGTQGNQGVAGTNGSNGAQGYQGNQGVAGTAGSNGTQGNQGVAGTAGSNGTQGNQGVAGTAGSAGVQGTQGNQGVTGTTGSNGTQGNQGVAGTAGSNGTQGNQGNQGATGTGTQGPQGSGGGGGSPGGSNTQLQYNNSGSFGGASYLATDGTTLYIGNSTNSQTTHLSYDLLTTTGPSLVLQQTGDSYGSSSLTIQNRTGSGGALFYGGGNELVDFGFATDSGIAQNNLRLEQRSTYNVGYGNSLYGEFQFLMNSIGSPYYQTFAHGYQTTVFYPYGGGSDGNVGISINAPVAKLHILNGTSSKIGEIIQGASGQSVDLVQWRNNGSSVLSGVDQNGYIRTLNTTGTPTTTPSVGSMTFDPSANKLYIYGNAGWKSVALT